MDASVVTDAFTVVKVVVGLVISSGIVVCVSWLIGRISKRGLNQYGAGDSDVSGYDRPFGPGSRSYGPAGEEWTPADTQNHYQRGKAKGWW